MCAVLPMIESMLVCSMVKLTVIRCNAWGLTSSRMFFTISQWIYFLCYDHCTTCPSCSWSLNGSQYGLIRRARRSLGAMWRGKCSWSTWALRTWRSCRDRSIWDLNCQSWLVVLNSYYSLLFVIPISLLQSMKMRWPCTRYVVKKKK